MSSTRAAMRYPNERFQQMLRSCSRRRAVGPLALAAGPANLDYRPRRRKARILRRGTNTAGQIVVVDVQGLSAIVADQEDTVVQATRVLVGNISVGALDPPG